MTPTIDQTTLRFDPGSLDTLQVILGAVMFGVALDLSVDDFRRLLRAPRAPLTGFLAQVLVLPALAAGLGVLLPIPASVALGLILVAACPGGNVSNFITHVGGGRTSTSVGMTALSTVAAIVTTPANLALWGSASPRTRALVETVALDPWDMLVSVGVLLGLPVAAGIAVHMRLPRLARALRGPLQGLSLAFFVVFVGVAIANNFDKIAPFLPVVFGPVLLLNALALALGWGAAAATGCDVPDRRAVAVEVGIQNSGLGLVLVFSFFHGLGGMAMAAAWWGIWHILAGLSLAGWWRWQDRRAAG